MGSIDDLLVSASTSSVSVTIQDTAAVRAYDCNDCVQAITGFNTKMDKQFVEAAKISDCEVYEKCVILLLDEMHIRKDLVFDEITGTLVCLVNLGDTNNSHLLDYERSRYHTYLSTIHRKQISALLGQNNKHRMYRVHPSSR